VDLGAEEHVCVRNGLDYGERLLDIRGTGLEVSTQHLLDEPELEEGLCNPLTVVDLASHRVCALEQLLLRRRIDPARSSGGRSIAREWRVIPWTAMASASSLRFPILRADASVRSRISSTAS